MTFLGIEVAPIVQAAQEIGMTVLRLLPKVLFAMLLLLLGLRIINCVTDSIQRWLETAKIHTRSISSRSFSDVFNKNSNGSDVEAQAPELGKESCKLDSTLLKFAVSFVKNGLKCLLLVSIASMLNISTTSIVAIFTMCSLSIGLAMQGLLKDLAAGVMLLIFRPFKVGDLIETESLMGRVHEIALFEIVLHTLDNKVVIVPTSAIKIVTNISEQCLVRVDVPIKIGHDENLISAKLALMRCADLCSHIRKEPEPQVLVSDIDEFGIELIVRAWVLRDDYIGGPFAIREQAILALNEIGVSLARMPSFLHHGTQKKLPGLLQKNALPAKQSCLEDDDEDESFTDMLSKATRPKKM